MISSLLWALTIVMAFFLSTPVEASQGPMCQPLSV